MCCRALAWMSNLSLMVWEKISPTIHSAVCFPISLRCTHCPETAPSGVSFELDSAHEHKTFDVFRNAQAAKEQARLQYEHIFVLYDQFISITLWTIEALERTTCIDMASVPLPISLFMLSVVTGHQNSSKVLKKWLDRTCGQESYRLGSTCSMKRSSVFSRTMLSPTSSLPL